MNPIEKVHETILDYGIILQDNEFECDNGCHRIRIIQLEEHIYSFVKCFLLKNIYKFFKYFCIK